MLWGSGPFSIVAMVLTLGSLLGQPWRRLRLGFVVAGGPGADLPQPPSWRAIVAMGSTCELTCLPCVAPYGVGVPPPLWCPHDVHKSTPLVATCLVQWDACGVLSGVNAPTLLVCVYPLFGVHVSATMMPIGRLLWCPWVTCAGVCRRMSEPKRPKMQASCCIVAFLHSWVFCSLPRLSSCVL